MRYAAGGTYTIRVEVTDDAGDSSDRLATAIIAAGQTSSLAGYVYLDVNNNGIKDPPEKALPNVPVTLSAVPCPGRLQRPRTARTVLTICQPARTRHGGPTAGLSRWPRNARHSAAWARCGDNQFYGIELPPALTRPTTTSVNSVCGRS